MKDKTFDSKKLFSEKLKITYLLSAALFLIVLDEFVDQVGGFTKRELFFDILLEVPTFTILIYTLHYVWNKFLAEKQDKEKLQLDLEQTKTMAQEWEMKSKDFPIYFESYINHQFHEWNLSKSEAEVAWLILKGKSSKEIAAERFTSDRTIRNQSLSLYEKSQCKGRNELCGYFIQRILH